MKRLFMAMSLMVVGVLFTAQEANAGHVGAGVGLQIGGGGVGFGLSVGGGAVRLNIGGAGFNQRYVAAGQAWVNEPYIYWQSIPDPTTGRIYRVQRIGYTRRLVVLYLDTWTGGYGYFDRFGNPIPYRRF